jgi:CubicO group peptidase (beta-lactamase class C family)
MDDSFFVLSDPRQIARMSVGYSRSRSGEVSAERATQEHFGRGYKVPNGGIYSTVGDLARFAAALMGVSEVRILGDPGLLDMRTPQPPAARYGLGLSISDRDGGLRVIGHGGSVAGYNAYLAFDPLSRLGVAMLRTTEYEPPVVELLEELVATTVAGGLAPGEPITVPDFAFDEYLPDHFDPSVSAPLFRSPCDPPPTLK